MCVCVYKENKWPKYLYHFLVLQCDTQGGLKRMGGQGDILSGAIAAFLAWGKAYEENVWK